ncbi:hypothetical protein EDD86DRAFT_188159 [Gorgonomyces haynaldii]|nr:hypothetical protein EDD86DRAFT_188159 [Gorgonomyces haynaldii]
MNSILQCLFAIKPLVGYFQSNEYLKHIKKGSGQVARSFGDLVKEATSNGVLSPHMFKRHMQQRATQFEGNDQHDAQEFLRLLVDCLHSDLNLVDTIPKFNYSDKDFDALSHQDRALVSWNRYLRYENSVIFSIFGGQLESTITCQHCYNRSTTFEVFWDLSVPLPQKQNMTVMDCINEFFKEEILDDQYNCSQCKAPRKSTKKLSIYQLPPILVVHFKRFKSGGYIRGGKVSAPIRFPTEDLDVHPVLSNIDGSQLGTKYHLVAVSNHFGSLHGGHYTATTRFNNEWLDKNDSTVGQGRLDYEAAYILFYEQSR